MDATCRRCEQLSLYAREASSVADRLLAENPQPHRSAEEAFRAGVLEGRLSWVADRLAEHAKEHGHA